MLDLIWEVKQGAKGGKKNLGTKELGWEVWKCNCGLQQARMTFMRLSAL